ncbi:MAG: hypothetical protein ACRBBK_00970 [Paracoccaceae bacterium]
MRNLIIATVTLIIVASCSSSSSFDWKRQGEYKFFPTGIWGEDSEDDSYERWFGNQLASMNEKPLWVQNDFAPEDQTIRLTFLPSFGRGKMLSISSEKSETPHYRLKVLSGRGGYGPGNLAYEKDGVVEPQAFAKIEALLAKIDPFSGDLPPIVQNPKFACFDGTQTVLEFVNSENYVAITRHECDMPKNDPIRKLINTFNDVSEGHLIAEGTFLALFDN